MKIFFIVITCTLPIFCYGQDKDLDEYNKAINRKKNEIVGKSYYKFSLMESDKKVSNADFDGKVVLINFWHSSCTPCIAEMEALNKLYDTFMPNPNFVFLSVTFEGKAKILKMKSKLNVKFPVYSINDEECERMMYHFPFPTNIILSDSGIVKYISPGASLDKQKNIDYFQKVLYPIIESELNKSKPISIKQSHITQF